MNCMTLSWSRRRIEQDDTIKYSCIMQSPIRRWTDQLCFSVSKQLNTTILWNIHPACHLWSADQPHGFLSKWPKRERSNSMTHSFNMRSTLDRSNAWLCVEVGYQVYKTILWNIHSACHHPTAAQPHEFESKWPNRWIKQWYEIFIEHAIINQHVNRMNLSRSGLTSE
jgi:hypothetical protein